MTKWLDAHTHLDSNELYPQRREVLDRAAIAGVHKLLLVNSDPTETSFERTVDCLEMEHSVARYGSFGVHPHHAIQYGPELETRLLNLLNHERVVALGEFGLDFYYDNSPRDVQESVLKRQLELSRERNLPVVIHCRDAYGRLAEILRSQAVEWKGMIHCFTGTPGEMKPLLDLGFHISFSGIVTFRTAETLRQCASEVPPDRILVETDAPFLAPVPYRGKLNEPSFVVETAKFVAGLRNESLEVLAQAVNDNFARLFGLRT